MIYTSPGESIEGDKINASGRRFEPKHPKSISGKLHYTFKITIYGEAQIQETLAPSASKHNTCSAICLGDEIQGESIYGHCKKPVTPHLENLTSEHKGTTITARGAAYAEIVIPRREVATSKKQITGQNILQIPT